MDTPHQTTCDQLHLDIIQLHSDEYKLARLDRRTGKLTDREREIEEKETDEKTEPGREPDVLCSKDKRITSVCK